MRVYYEKRAAEYDDWWRGTGLFAARERPGWHEDVDGAGRGRCAALAPARTLDLACGTGFLTRVLPGDGDRRRPERVDGRDRAFAPPGRGLRGRRRARAAAGVRADLLRALLRPPGRGAAGGVPRAAAVVGAGRGRLGAAAGGGGGGLAGARARRRVAPLASTSAGSRRRGWRRRSAARCSTTARGSSPSEVRARAPERGARRCARRARSGAGAARRRPRRSRSARPSPGRA